MIENIKRIGLFMIVAQTFMHFAAGQKYEKYIKIITGIIILLLFIRPFSSSAGNAVDQWQEELEQMTERIENYSNEWQNKMTGLDFGSERKTIQQIEMEIKRRFNREIASDNWEVTDVMIEWTESTGEDNDGNLKMDIRCIVITLRHAGQKEENVNQEDADALIVVDEIQVDLQSESARQNSVQEDFPEQNKEEIAQYRSLFAEILGIEEEKLEVVYSGSG